MMRIFGHYDAGRIARYVKTFFRGRLYIKGVGAFEFNYGRLQLPQKRDNQHLSVMSEVNRKITQLRIVG